MYEFSTSANIVPANATSARQPAAIADALEESSGSELSWEELIGRLIAAHDWFALIPLTGFTEIEDELAAEASHVCFGYMITYPSITDLRAWLHTQINTVASGEVRMMIDWVTGKVSYPMLDGVIDLAESSTISLLASLRIMLEQSVDVNDMSFFCEIMGSNLLPESLKSPCIDLTLPYAAIYRPGIVLPLALLLECREDCPLESVIRISLRNAINNGHACLVQGLSAFTERAKINVIDIMREGLWHSQDQDMVVLNAIISVILLRLGK